MRDADAGSGTCNERKTPVRMGISCGPRVRTAAGGRVGARRPRGDFLPGACRVGFVQWLVQTREAFLRGVAGPVLLLSG